MAEGAARQEIEILLDLHQIIAGTSANLAGDVRAMWTAFVMRRTAEGWKISAIRNMLPAPPGK